MEILDPTKIPNWDEMLLNTPGYSFFHSKAWARCLMDSYGYRPLYFASLNGSSFQTLIPFMEVRNLLNVPRGVSLPFTDYCEPIHSGGDLLAPIVDQIYEYGKKAGWKNYELRKKSSNSEGNPVATVFKGHTVDLSGGTKNTYKGFSGSTRRNIRKAVKEGVNTVRCQSWEGIEKYYALHCLTRKEHGIPPQPIFFFRKIYENIIGCGLGSVFIASYGGKAIGAAVFFHLGAESVFKYGAYDRRYQKLRPNNLVMWEGIKWYSENGYRSLCLGRTDPDDIGLIRFKDGWGAEQKEIRYYRYDYAKGGFINACPMTSKLPARILRQMPHSVLRLIGRIFYKYSG